MTSPKQVSHNSNSKIIRPPYKIETALLEFIKAGRAGLNTLEANQIFGETCLHSTVSDITRLHRIRFSHTKESITNRAGTKSFFTRYKLEHKNHNFAAMRLINKYRLKRGARPIDWSISGSGAFQYEPRKKA